MLEDEEACKVGSDCTQTDEEEKGFGQRKYTRREEVEEMNDEALHYAMIGGRPKEKQRAIEQHQQAGMPGCNGC